MISFDFKPDKFASAAAYIAERRPGATKKDICKLMFFADKSHLLRYGRTITGDYYCALEQGPIPSQGLDAMNEHGSEVNIAAIQKYGRLEGWTFILREKADLKSLSRSDLRVLDETLQEYGQLPTWKLEEISHLEPAWAQTRRNQRMDFLLFFEGHPEADDIKAILTEEEHKRVLTAG